MADPIGFGFRNFSIQIPSSTGVELVRRRAKYTSSVLQVKKFSPVVAVASNLLDRATVTGGVNEVQTLTPAQGATDTGGTFRINFVHNGVTYTTSSISASASQATIQAALDVALSDRTLLNPPIGAGAIVVGGGAGNGFFTAAGVVNGTALTLTFKNKLGSYNVAQVTITSALTGTTPSITPSTTTAGTSGYVSDSAILGFANEWERGPLESVAGVQSYGRQFAQAPLNLDGKFVTDPFEVAYYFLTRPVRFYGAIEPWKATTAAMVGTTVDMGYLADFGQFYVASGGSTNAIVRITGIPDGELGKIGGQVEFQIPSTAVTVS